MFNVEADDVHIEMIRSLPTRPMTLADTLRTILTVEDLKDLDAAMPKLLTAVRRTGSKAGPPRIKAVVTQMLEEAGL